MAICSPASSQLPSPLKSIQAFNEHTRLPLGPHVDGCLAGCPQQRAECHAVLVVRGGEVVARGVGVRLAIGFAVDQRPMRTPATMVWLAPLLAARVG